MSTIKGSLCATKGSMGMTPSKKQTVDTYDVQDAPYDVQDAPYYK